MAKDVTIFHKPTCSTSRNTLAMIREAGIEPTVVDYMKTGWAKTQLQDLLKAMGKAPRDILRTKEDLAGELGLTGPGVSDDQILDAMVQHPVLVERPIVVGPRGTVLCRPAEACKTVL